MNGRVVAVGLGRLAREEDGSIDRDGELGSGLAAAHAGVTVGAAREGIRQPVVAEAAPQILAQPVRVDAHGRG